MWPLIGPQCSSGWSQTHKRAGEGREKEKKKGRGEDMCMYEQHKLDSGVVVVIVCFFFKEDTKVRGCKEFGM